MSEVFAKAGEAVTTPEGKVICYVKNDLVRHAMNSAHDFHEFAEGETPWKQHEKVDPRCVRELPDSFGALQICIQGEWRP